MMTGQRSPNLYTTRGLCSLMNPLFSVKKLRVLMNPILKCLTGQLVMRGMEKKRIDWMGMGKRGGDSRQNE